MFELEQSGVSDAVCFVAAAEPNVKALVVGRAGGSFVAEGPKLKPKGLVVDCGMDFSAFALSGEDTFGAGAENLLGEAWFSDILSL